MKNLIKYRDTNVERLVKLQRQQKQSKSTNKIFISNILFYSLQVFYKNNHK